MKNNLNQIESASSPMWTSTPVVAHNPARFTPEFIRLPKSGTLCPHSALSRSKLNELVLPSLLNNFKPPVQSISLRNRGRVKAVRLVVYDSLMAYLRSFLQDEITLKVIILFAALAAMTIGHSGRPESEARKTTTQNNIAGGTNSDTIQRSVQLSVGNGGADYNYQNS